ncbi:MAG: tetratricopeptide repeat protein [Candidatus Heimdallarchaeota archaeon]
MNLPEIHEMVQKGDYHRALEAIDALSSEAQLDGLIFKGRILERKGELKDALRVSGQALKESKTRGTKLQEVNALINHGYAHYALRNLDELAETIRRGEQLLDSIAEEAESAQKQYRSALAYLHGYLKFSRGEVPQALDYLQHSLAIREELANPQDIAESAVALGWVHLNATGKADLALTHFQRGLALREALGNKSDIAHSLNRLGTYYLRKQDLDTALSYYEKSLALYQALEDQRWIAGLLNNLAIIHQNKEEYDLALEYYRKTLETWKELGDRDGMAIAYQNMGGLHGDKGELDQSLEYQKRSLALREALGQKLGVADVLGNIGELYALKGELELALANFEKGLKLSKEAGSDDRTAWRLYFIGWVYLLKGEPELALDNLDHCQKIFDELDNKFAISWCLILKGVAYKLLGDLALATTLLEEGWTLIKKFVSAEVPPLMGSFALFHLILLAKDRDTPDKAEKFLREMQELRQKSTNRVVQLRTRFAEAVVLKMSKRALKKLQAQEKFKEIVEEEILEHDITVLAMLNLCELLILEMKITEAEEDLLQEITQLSSKLYNIAHRQGSPLLLVMSLLLQAKLAMVEGELKDAVRLLTTAQKLATEKKLGTLLVQVEQEQQLLQGELDKWEELSQRNAPLKERVEQARMEEYLEAALKLQETWVRPSTDSTN